MNYLTQWVHNTLKAAAAYIKGDKSSLTNSQRKENDHWREIDITKNRLNRKKKPKPRKKVKKKLKKAA